MDSQYTPTYHRMWNRDFTLLVVAELLFCASCYMTVPLLPHRLAPAGGDTELWATLSIVLFVAGICLSGLFGSWLIQRYRRNKVFLVSAIALSISILGLSLFDVHRAELPGNVEYYAPLAVSFICGALFGNGKRVLSCTLLIDKTESCHRTDANYTAIWIARLSAVAGPAITIALHDSARTTTFYIASAAASFISAILVMCVKFPFRAPEEGVHILSFDRFFLPQGWNVSLVIATMTAALGIMLATRFDIDFCLSIMAGFAVAGLIMQYPSIRKARFTSAVGNACSILAVLAMSAHDDTLDGTLKPMLIGIGIAITSSEQFYKLLDHSNHCQRSTVESTYFLSSDGGLFLGLAAGWTFGGNYVSAQHTALVLLAVATLLCCANALVKKKRKEFRA